MAKQEEHKTVIVTTHSGRVIPGTVREKLVGDLIRCIGHSDETVGIRTEFGYTYLRGAEIESLEVRGIE